MYERKLIPIDELGLKVIGISLHLAAVVQKRLCLNNVWLGFLLFCFNTDCWPRRIMVMEYLQRHFETLSYVLICDRI